MLKRDKCWRCDTTIASAPTMLNCTRCEVACYCSDECKNSDLFRHQVDCQTAALDRTCSGCGREGRRLKQCGSCLQAWYCDQTCLKKSWPRHKVSCKQVTKKIEDLSNVLKLAYDVQMRTPGVSTVYYWGNIPAVDLINLPLNEGCDYSKPLSILVCGVGDPRNVVLSLSQLPDEYKEEVTFVLNDICACTLARTVFLLYCLFKGGDQLANSVTQIWYSLRLSEEDYQLVISTLQELIQASTLEELTRGAMKVEQTQLQKLIKVWRTWLDLSSRKGDWITEGRRRMFEDDPRSEEGIDFYLKEIPKEHKDSASDWMENGILLPIKCRKELPRENVTLTGSSVFNRNKRPFNYILVSSVLPFLSWDYKQVKHVGYSSSILEMYSHYVSHVLHKSAVKLATGQVKFHFLLCNCMEMTPFLPPDRKYDRVTTSNIADYVSLTSILDMCKPLLNTINPSAVIVTEFQNWAEQFTNLRVEASRIASQMPPKHILRKRVLDDTKNPAIAYSTGGVGFTEYHDHSAEFTTFLRAALLVSKIPNEPNTKRTWNSVAAYNGLTARNFLRIQNRVFPAKWQLNCRRVTMLTGYERAVEWVMSSSSAPSPESTTSSSSTSASSTVRRRRNSSHI